MNRLVRESREFFHDRPQRPSDMTVNTSHKLFNQHPPILPLYLDEKPMTSTDELEKITQ